MKLLILFFLALTACEKKENPESLLDSNKTFRFFASSAVPTMDWSKATDTTSSMVVDSIMEGLTAYDFSKKEIAYQPALAQKIESADDGKKWIFTLKPNVYWTDGVLFTGQHILDSWERVLNPQTASEYAYFLFHIKNAKEYNSGKIKDFSKVGVRLAKDGKIEVELTGSKYFFPYALTHTTTYPIRKDLIEKHGPEWILPKNMATLGPYRLHHWQQDKILILKKNNRYHGSFKGNVENVVIKIIPEISTVLNLFDAGQLDLVHTLPSNQLASLKKKPEFFASKKFGAYYYGFHIKKPPVDQLKIRKAISMAIDRKQLVRIMDSTVTASSSWIPPQMFGYNPKIGHKFNPQKAQELMKEAGPLKEKITLSYNTNEDHKRIAENIQSQLKANLGLSIELINEEWKVYLKNLKHGKTALFRMGWIADYPDPNNFMNLFTSYSDNNHTGWGDKEFDRIIEEASKLPNNENRKKLYDQAQKILIERDTAILPLFTMQDQFLISKRIKHYPLNIMSKFIFKDVVLEKTQ